jgi:hypothetical protein
MVYNSDDSDGTVLNLFEENLKYMIRPQFPNTALVDPDDQPFADDETNGVALVLNNITGVGDAAASEAVVTVTGLKEDVCKRINVTANGVLVSADLPAAINDDSNGWREGCYTDGTDYIYYRVVATDVKLDA